MSILSMNIAASSTVPRDLSSAFTLDAVPNTDIYATPLAPVRHVFSAPVVCRRIAKYSFQSAQASIRSRWSLQFDQGGLIFIMPKTCTAPNADNAQTADAHPEWVKVGVEVNLGRPYVSVVAKSRENWCDWSLLPLAAAPLGEESEATTVFATRSQNALMIWTLSDGQKVLVRKVPWVFLEAAGDVDAAQDMLVGAYAARPDPGQEANDQKLRVSFEGFDLKVHE
jgi:regulation of enolase protein 1 (concanavalin A-like superfamily)